MFGIFGAAGLVFITLGVITKKRMVQDLYYIIGGILLLIYSISIDDIIFIILQGIFILAALFDYLKRE